MTPQDPLIAYLATHNAPCPECGYNLRGLKSITCPECGTDLLDSGLLAELWMDDQEAYDALYEIGGIGTASAMVGSATALAVLTASLALYSAFTPGFFTNAGGAGTWVTCYVILIVLAGVTYWLDDIWDGMKDKFRAMPKADRLKIVFAAWWWLWCMLIGLIVAPFL
ncbi:MAG: hypothetical protein KDA31_05840 [Phycisphaerales bacterium]|nr:hypothetical protein [Phycisphaerales bacterium]MCB9835863.1 hypothetical protein [Phycisphaera sp.]